MVMTFEEEFPSLKIAQSGHFKLWSTTKEDIQKHCFDKSKVKQAIEKRLKSADDRRAREGEREAVRMEGMVEAYADLLKELGLE